MPRTKSKVQRTDNMDEMKALVSMVHSNVPDLKEEGVVRLWEKCEDFVWHMIKTEFSPYYSDFEIREELHSACKVAFMEYVESFDPEKGTLTTWMTYPMRHAITEYIDDMLSRSSGYYSKQMRAVEDATRHLQLRGIPVTADGIAYYADMSVKQVEKILKRIEATKTKSFDSSEELESMITSHLPSPEEAFWESEANDTIQSALATLPEMDRLAVIKCFGLDMLDPRSYAAVAKELGVSAPMVETMIARSLRVLRGNDSLRNMFAKGAKSYRQRQLDTIEISLVTNEKVRAAYDCLDEEPEVDTARKETKVVIKF